MSNELRVGEIPGRIKRVFTLCRCCGLSRWTEDFRDDHDAETAKVIVHPEIPEPIVVSLLNRLAEDIECSGLRDFDPDSTIVDFTGDER